MTSPFTSEVDAEMAATFNRRSRWRADHEELHDRGTSRSWFKDTSGAVIDPTDPANAEAIERNIRRSARVFEDDDHDGVDDHEEGTHE